MLAGSGACGLPCGNASGHVCSSGIRVMEFALAGIEGLSRRVGCIWYAVVGTGQLRP